MVAWQIRNRWLHSVIVAIGFSYSSFCLSTEECSAPDVLGYYHYAHALAKVLCFPRNPSENEARYLNLTVGVCIPSADMMEWAHAQNGLAGSYLNRSCGMIEDLPY